MTIWGYLLTLTLAAIMASFGSLWLASEPIIAWGIWTVALSLLVLGTWEARCRFPSRRRRVRYWRVPR